MSAITSTGGDVGEGLCATGDKLGSNVLGLPAEAGGITRVRSVCHIGLVYDTSSEKEWRGEGILGGVTPHPTPPGRPILTGSPYQNTY